VAGGRFEAVAPTVAAGTLRRVKESFIKWPADSSGRQKKVLIWRKVGQSPFTMNISS